MDKVYMENKNDTINWPAWPQYGVEEQNEVVRVLQSNQIFADREVKVFEEEYAAYVGSKYAVGLGNATHGLHLALAALNIGEGDEVIVTPYTWISSASCILMQNAVPVFCDIEADSLGLSPKELTKKITDKTKAIIVVHIYGYPARIKEIMAIANEHGIPVIEDASHAHGAELENKKMGTFGLISVFSLHQRKALSVGDGGIVCTDSQEIYEKIRRLRSFGHEELSYNFRMTEFAGVLGQVGLRKLDKENLARKHNAIYLAELLKDFDQVKVRLGFSNELVVFYAVLIEIVNDVPNIAEIIKEMQNAGIPIRETWSPLHKHPHFNPVTTPARGLPWRDSLYNGQMKNSNYSELHLPVVEKYCPNKILELYIHPPTGRKEIEFAAKKIIELFSE